MGDANTLPVLLVGRDAFCLKYSLQTVHVFAVTHVALRIFSGCFGHIGPLGEICLQVS